MAQIQSFMFIVALACIFLSNVNANQTSTSQQAAEMLHACNVRLSEVIIQDGFSPPVASRIYAYCNIVAYEIIITDNKQYKSLSGQIKDLKPIPPKPLQANSTVAFLIAFCEVARKMVYRDYLLDEFENEQVLKFTNTPNSNIDLSKKWGQQVAEHFKKWIDDDNYNKSRTLSRYSVSQNPSSWQPTAPNYGEAIEPHWRIIRTLVLDSAAQFKVPAHIEFSKEKDSPFYKSAYEVYSVVKEADSTQKHIAKFWDCNPISPNRIGHLVFSQRQLTPGGHWVNIIRIVSEKQKLDVYKSTTAYTLACIAIMDAFIACWHEKYTSNLIRPETYIQKYIDPNWRPILITPEFPEHPSGHSTISAAAATVLTKVIGDNIEFTDNTEDAFGVEPRHFTSFQHAAQEAGISRFYGGIHYKTAVFAGETLGKQIGNWVLSKIHTQ